jgi:hypothetical protein
MKSFSSLHVFCQHVVKKYDGPDGLSEEQLAGEFRNVYLKGLPLNLKTIKAVAASCGIKLNGLEKMPENLRGYHEVFGDNKNIYFWKGDALSGIQNTILHEIREMMETLFAEVNPDYTPLRTSARHIAANRFATAVLLPRPIFTQKIYETGFDIVELSKIFSKSSSQIILRMGEVLQGKLFMYSALYEPDPDNQWHVTYWTGSCNDTDPDANIYGLDGFFPRKGRVMTPDSLVDLVVREEKPYLAQRITLLDSMDDEGLVALATPIMISGIPTKVALLVLLGQNRDLLEPQMERTKPTIIEGFHRHL